MCEKLERFISIAVYILGVRSIYKNKLIILMMGKNNENQSNTKGAGIKRNFN